VKPPSKRVHLGSLKINERNPRTITKEAFGKLCESIKRDPGFMDLRPIVADIRDRVILGGTQRYRACAALGMTSVPASWVRLGKFSPAQRKRFIIVDNAPDGMAGEWDDDILAADYEMKDLKEMGIEVPDFVPVSMEEQGRLDEKSPVTCPKCGHEFTT